jgi:hypothetical protein
VTSDDERLRTGQEVTVARVKARRDDVEYPMVVVDDDRDRLTVTGPYSESEPRDLGYVTFEPTDRFTEHFWRSRWYTIAAIVDRDGRPKGWYCDVARPATVRSGRVESIDLELDVWFPAAGGPPLRLDEDEFAALGLAETDPHAHGAARQAVEELLRLDPRRLRSLAP